MRSLGYAFALLVFLWGSAEAAPLFLTPGQNLDFGEGILNSALAQGSIAINGFTGAVQTSNVTLLTPAVPGTFIIEGSPLAAYVVTVTAGVLACDTTYVNPCTGTPTLSLTNNASGTISTTNCRSRLRCQDTVTVGGTFTYPPAAEGRWTTTITIIANYQ